MKDTINIITLLEYINNELDHGIEYITMDELLELFSAEGF